MEENRYEFIEEVIKKQPCRIKKVILKIISLLGIAALFCMGAALLGFVFRDELKENFSEKTLSSKINVAVDEGESSGDMDHVAELEEQVNRSIVSVYRADKSSGQMALLCTGVIISMDEEVYIMVPYDKMKDQTDMAVMFCDGTAAKAVFWNKDSAVGIAIIVVDREHVGEDTIQKISSAVIGSGDCFDRGYNFVYEGNPFSQEVLNYTGNIAGISEIHDVYDLYCRAIYTDVAIAGVEDGFLFDSYAKLTGMILSRFNNSDNSTISAVAVYDLYDVINGILNKESLGYIGIQGEYVGYEIKKYINQDMPDGLYVTSVDNTAAAYLAGIMTGDIIVGINNAEIEEMDDITKFISGKKPGDVITVSLKRKMGEGYKDFAIDVTVGERE